MRTTKYKYQLVILNIISTNTQDGPLQMISTIGKNEWEKLEMDKMIDFTKRK